MEVEVDVLLVWPPLPGLLPPWDDAPPAEVEPPVPLLPDGTWQTPLEQEVAFDGHSLPQSPQFFMSLAVFVQLFPHCF